MEEKAYRAVAEAVRLLAGAARHEAREMEAHRAALARNALVWWQGGAAQHYQALVQERVSAFTTMAGYLDGLAGRADDLAAELEASAEVEAAVEASSAAHPVLFR